MKQAKQGRDAYGSPVKKSLQKPNFCLDPLKREEQRTPFRQSGSELIYKINER